MDPHAPTTPEPAESTGATTASSSDALSSFPEEVSHQEVDVWWGAYSWQALLPGLFAGLTFSALVVGLAWYLVSWRGLVQLRYSAHALLGLFWLVQLSRWVYRLFGWNYRLTTRRLFVERGFGHPGRPGFPLAQISQVMVSRRPLQYLCRVGQVLILELGNAQPALILEGVRRPEHIAMLIRNQIQRNRASAPTDEQ